MIHSLSGGVLDGDGYQTRDGFTSEGEVLKVDKNVSEKCSPVPIKRALKIIKKL